MQKNVVEQLDEAQEQLQDRVAEPTGLVRINAPVFFGQRHIAPWLANLYERYPKLSVDLTLTDEFIDPLKEGADLMFRISKLGDSSFHAKILASQHYYLAASPRYIAQHGQPETPEELCEHQCLVYKGFKVRIAGWYKTRMRVGYSALSLRISLQITPTAYSPPRYREWGSSFFLTG
ncbi:substrate binding domain-containing protein [Vibrio olivae]